MDEKNQEDLRVRLRGVQAQKDKIIETLKKNGFRMTRQRRILLDIILENECVSCKEIYYRASRQHSGIGLATVYRMVGILEEIGVISRNNPYRVTPF